MEITAHLKPADNLIGVVNKAESNEVCDTAMIFINAGFLHRVGPYRLYTDLSRALAEHGISSLRFDLSGLGDSLQTVRSVSQEAKNSDSSPVADIKAAMDYMQNDHGISKFLVSGLCSGADDALDVAVADNRVVGAFLIDGPGFKTQRFHLYHYLLHYPRRIIEPQKWRVLLDRVTNRGSQEPAYDLNDDIRRTMTKDELCSMTARLVENETALMFLYTGGVSDYYNHRGQFKSMFPGLSDSPFVSTQYLPESDHLFMLNEHREQLKQSVINWCLKTSFGANQNRQAA